MKQVLIHKGQVSVADVPAPLVRPGQVLVEVAYSLISPGTEAANVSESGKSLARRAMERPDQVRKLLQHLKARGIRKTLALVQEHLDTPTPTGYSCSGAVVQVGADVTDLLPGDAVACGGAGYANHAELVVAPRNLVVKVPSSCPLQDAASVTLGAIALQGVRRAGVSLGESVAVVGLGILGMLTVQLLQAAGCRTLAVDLNPRRADLARSLTPECAVATTGDELASMVRQRTGGQGVDATIITADASGGEVVQQAMELTRKKGRVVVVGNVGLRMNR